MESHLKRSMSKILIFMVMVYLHWCSIAEGETIERCTYLVIDDDDLRREQID